MKLYKYAEDFGRMGDLDGMFFATEEQHERFMGKEGYASDILGKHSEVYLQFNDETIEEVELSETTIEEMFAVFGYCISGISALDYFEQWDEEEEEEDVSLNWGDEDFDD